MLNGWGGGWEQLMTFCSLTMERYLWQTVLYNFAYTVIQMTNLKFVLSLVHSLAQMLRSNKAAKRYLRKQGSLKRPQLVPCAQRIEDGLVLKAPDKKLPLLGDYSHATVVYLAHGGLITPLE